MYATVICLAVVLCGAAGVESEEASRMKRKDNTLTTNNKRFPDISQTLDDFEARTRQMETTLKHKRYYEIINKTAQDKGPSYDFVPFQVQEALIFFKAEGLANRTPNRLDTLRFTDVKNNDTALGRGYDKSRGVFTVALDGIYLIIVQLCSIDSKGICYSIRVKSPGNVYKDILMSRVYDNKYDTCSSDLAIVKLRFNEEVYITNLYDHNTFAEDSIRHNVFSGILLHQTYQ